MVTYRRWREVLRKSIARSRLCRGFRLGGGGKLFWGKYGAVRWRELGSAAAIASAAEFVFQDQFQFLGDGQRIDADFDSRMRIYTLPPAYAFPIVW